MTFAVMSPKEIEEKYRRADSKAEILQVLADLTVSTPEEVAEFLGVPCSYSAYSGKGRPAEFSHAQAKQLYDLGFTDAQIANELGVSRRTINRWRQKEGLEGRMPVVLDAEQAMELYQQGLRDGEIAQKIGVSKSRVWSWRKKMGLPVVGKPIKTDWRKLPV